MKKLIKLITLSITLVVISLSVVLSLNNKESKVSATDIDNPTLSVYKKNLSYSSEIYIMYAVEYAGFNPETYPVKMLFYDTVQTEYTKDNATYEVATSGKIVVSDVSCLVYASKGLSAKQMTEDIYARAYVEIDDQIIYSEVVKYSVLEYTYEAMGKVNEKITNLLLAMKEYGSCAQINFDYLLDRLANATYYNVNVVGGTLADGFTQGRFNSIEEFTLVAPIKEGYEFVNWTNSQGVEVSKDMTYTTTVSNDETFTANYQEDELNIEIFEENGISYIYLGSYPQSVETDENVINNLNNILETNSLGYIEYNGIEYKKVTATPYQYSTQYFTNGQTIVKDNTYYFKVEPIKWRILGSNDGTYKLLSELIIDNPFFCTSYSNRTINGTTIYRNNYEYSNIRAWLNGYDGTSYEVDNYTNKGFIDIAFTEREKALINETIVGNSLSSTGDSENEYVCNNTTDKIYLLSYSEATNTNYGFCGSEAREAILTDYTRSKGCIMSNDSRYYSNGWWWLRSPIDYLDGEFANVVKEDGYPSAISYNVVNYSYCGVRAALEITMNGEEIKPFDHTESEWIIDTPATCIEKGYKHTECTKCNFIINTEEIEPLGHEYDEFGICAICGDKNSKINIEIFEENGINYLYLGKYPQTVEDDIEITSSLDSITTTNELGYIEYNGNEYKKVTATPYQLSTQYFTNGQTIVEGNTYYFKVEPIKWRILESSNGSYKLLSEMILDNTNFYHTWNEYRTINNKTIHPNNYEYSNIRAWLNGYDGTSYEVDNYTNKGFIDIAFTDEEKALINETIVDNSLSSTGDSENEYVCNNTTDKIYLLSYSEATNANYGFSRDKSRRAKTSDYARSKGGYMYNNSSSSYYGNGYWWLRSPYGYHYGVRVVDDAGSINYKYVDVSEAAVRAALEITI